MKKIVCAILTFAVKTLLCPKVYYAGSASGAMPDGEAGVQSAGGAAGAAGVAGAAGASGASCVSGASGASGASCAASEGGKICKKQGRPFIEEPSIIVCNHTSHLDGGVVNVVFGKNVIHSLAAKDRFEQKWFGFLLRNTGCIPIDRQNADTSWIYASMEALHKERACVAIYPEGRHGAHRQQLPFHSGVSMLAVMAQVPIVMVYLDGPHRLFHRTGMIIDEPFRISLPATGLSADFVDSQTRMLEQRMAALMQEYIRQAEGE